MAEDGKIKIDKFDGHDFGFWKMQTEDYLYQKKLHEPLAEAKPTGMKAKDWTLLDRQALGVVRLSLVNNMKDLGSAKQILGMSIIKDKTKGTLRLSQEKYIGNVLEKFNMKDAEARCQPLRDHFKLSKKQAPKTEASRRRMAKVPYASALGSEMYAMVCTMSDIAHAVRVVSRFMSNPGRGHLKAVKWLLRYLKGTSKATLCFIRKEVVLEGFSDLDNGGCLDSGKSTTSYVFTVGGIAVNWMSRIQKCVAMSTTKVEYMAIAEVGKELVWLKNFLEELDKAQT
ncbi:retrovirus-related pol polyprotein from transposon TNT 1-94 [Tanacetum coccineum]